MSFDVIVTQENYSHHIQDSTIFPTAATSKHSFAQHHHHSMEQITLPPSTSDDYDVDSSVVYPDPDAVEVDSVDLAASTSAATGFSGDGIAMAAAPVSTALFEANFDLLAPTTTTTTPSAAIGSATGASAQPSATLVPQSSSSKSTTSNSTTSTRRRRTRNSLNQQPAVDGGSGNHHFRHKSSSALSSSSTHHSDSFVLVSPGTTATSTTSTSASRRSGDAGSGSGGGGSGSASHHSHEDGSTSATRTTASTTTLTPQQEAMHFSQEASLYLQQERLEDSLEAYKKAADCYCIETSVREVRSFASMSAEQQHESILCAVNAAGCFRNMGAVCRLLYNYGEAVTHFQCAEELYTKARLHILQLAPSSHSATASDSSGAEEQLCLDLMILETMQSRATFYAQHLYDIKSAVQCHEHCIDRVLRHAESSHQPSSSTGHDTIVDGVVFTPLSPLQQTELVVTSLHALCELYRNTSSTNGGAWNETAWNALHFVMEQHRNNQGYSVPIASLIPLLRNVSDVLFAYNQWNRAQNVLQDAMDVEVTQALLDRRSQSHAANSQQSPPPRPDEYAPLASVEAMDEMGLAHERMEQYDRALTCYESALLARSRYYYGEGDTDGSTQQQPATATATSTSMPTHNSIQVAQSLIRVARVMELQGNTEGGLDLYRAAHAMYALQIVASDQILECPADAQFILELIPKLLEQERFEEARAYLTKCLAIADNHNESGENGAVTVSDAEAAAPVPVMDKSQIYYDLGRAYIGLRDYVSATICLVEAAKEEGQVTEEVVLVQLQLIDVLQREESRNSSSTSTTNSFMGSAGAAGASPATIRPSRSLDADERQSHNRGGQQHNPNRSRRSLSSSNLPADEIMREPTHLGRNLYNMHTKSSLDRGRPWSFAQNMPALLSDTTDATDMFDSVANDQSEPRTTFMFDEADAHVDSFYDTAPVRSTSIEASQGESSQSSVQNGAPRLIPDRMYLSDDMPGVEPGPLSSDSNGVPGVSSKGSLRGRGRRLGGVGGALSSPRKGKDEKMPVVTQQQQQQPPRPLMAKVWRPRSRQGFKSLQEEKGLAQAKPKLATEEDVTADDSTATGPVAILHVGGPMMDDDISEITMRFDDPNTSRDTSQEWWWGVTSEGFGRWFPASYVSQAVQAADAFLSAKAIHSKSKMKPDTAHSPDAQSKNESNEEDDDSCSDGRREYASNAGITSTKASRAQFAMASLTNPLLNEVPSHAPHHNSLFNSPSPLHFGANNDVTSEIATCREVLMQHQKEYGRSHTQVATSLFTLAILYSRDRDIDAAVECATEALRIQTSNNDLGDASQSLHFMADLYLHQKQFKQSLMYYSKALKLETSHFGYFCDNTAKTLNCMGTVQALQNEFLLAMESHEEALRILKECHGDDFQYPLVSETLCHIGSVYYRERNVVVSPDAAYVTFLEKGMLEVIGRAHEDRGCYKMAIAFFDEKLQCLESQDESREVLEDAATTLNGLGMLSSRAGLLVEAIEYYEKALSIQLQLGCDEVHLSTARVLTGAVQFQLGNWHQALKLFQDALACLQDELGFRHETVAATHFQIGTVQAALGDYDVAMDALNDALDIQNDLLGDDHPATLRTRREIGNLFAIYTAELDVAFGHFDSVLEHQKRVHGERHPNIAETLHSMGNGYAKRADFVEALRVLEECYYMRVEFLGWDHPLQASTLHDIAKIHLERGRADKASNICDMVLSIRRYSLSERHVDVARTLTTKGCCYLAAGDTDQAASCLTEALEMTQESLGESHPFVAEIHVEWGALYLRKCQFDMARSSIQKALDIYSWFNLDDDYYGIQDAKEKLDRVERDEMLCV